MVAPEQLSPTHRTRPRAPPSPRPPCGRQPPPADRLRASCSPNCSHPRLAQSHRGRRPSNPQGRRGRAGDCGRARPPFLRRRPPNPRPPALFHFPHPRAPQRAVAFRTFPPPYGPGAAHPWLRRGRRKRRPGLPVSAPYPNPALRATPRLRAAPLHKRGLCQTRRGHLPGPPPDASPEFSGSTLRGPPPKQGPADRLRCAAPNCRVDLHPAHPPPPPAPGPTRPTAPRLVALRASRLRRLVLVRASRGASTTHPRPNPLPVTAFLRRFEPGNGPGRHRANPSPAGFCSPQKRNLVSFFLLMPPARGRPRRISAAKSLSDKPLRGAAQPGKSLIRM